MANRSFWLFRISSVTLGGAAIWWGIVGIQLFWRQSVTERLADQIIVGDPFKKEILLNQIPVIIAIETAPYCRPIALRSAALIRLRIAEMSTSVAQNGSEEQLASSRSAISKSLICSPSDSFLWLSLFWVEAHSAPQLQNLEYLRLSYTLGPNEGWIALKRNWLAFENFGRLPPDLAEAAVDEFVNLVKSGFAERAAEILDGPAWPVRDRLLSRLKDVDGRQRQDLEYFLSKRQRKS